MPAMNFVAQQWVVPPDTGLPSHHVGHAVTRRAFIGSMASVAGAVAGVSLIPGIGRAAQLLCAASCAAPVPTSNTTVVAGTIFHFLAFGPGIDPSTIGDFNGFVGVADVRGTGTATNPDGSTETLLFDTDMRFMSGVYIGQDGAVHTGTFGEV